MLSSAWITHTVFTFYITVGIIYGIMGMSKGTCLCKEMTLQQTSELSPIIRLLSYRLPTLLAETRFLFFLPYQCANSIINFTCRLYLLAYWNNGLQFPPSNNPIHYYKSLRILSRKVNSLTGFLTLMYILEAIFAYPINFYDLVWSQVFLQKLLLLLFYGTTVAFLIGSAEICRRMQSLRNWMFETERAACLSCNDVALIWDDLGQNSVGVSASGVFTLNYYFVGTVTSLVLTFFIIRLQWTDFENGITTDSSPISV